MNNIANVKTQLRLQQWAQQIEACQQSGLPVTEWCNANNIRTNTYYYRLKQVREHTLNALQIHAEEIVATQPQEPPVTFKQLEVKSPISGMQAAVIIHLPEATVEIAQGTDQKTLEAVLLALRSTC